MPPEAPQGGQLELMAELVPNGATEAGLLLGTEGALTRLAYDEGAGLVRECPMPLAPGEALTLHLFWDRSTLEVFANGWAVMTARVYPAQPDRHRVAAYAVGAGAELRRLDLWQINAA